LPLSGGLIYSYQAGTTTPLATYFDNAGVTPHSNPIVLDASGRMPGGVMWIISSNTYKFVIQTSSAVQIASYDNISGTINSDASNVNYNQGGTGAVTRTVQNKLQEFISVKDFGATGNGTTDDTASITNAFAAAGGKRVLFPSGTYLIGSAYSAANGSRSYMEAGSSFVTNTPSNVDYVWEQNNTTATTGSLMKIDHLVENSAYPLKNEAGIWPGGPTYAYFGINKTMTSTTVPSQVFDASPITNTFIFTQNNGALAATVGLISDVVAETSNTSSFGANFIARNASGTSNTKLVGLEIDVEPSTGTTNGAGTSGLYINAFSLSDLGAAIQTGGVGGGSFQQGMVVNGISSDGAAYADQAGLSCSYGLALTNGSYSSAAIALSLNKNLRFWGSSITLATDIKQDIDDHLNINLAKDLLVTAPSNTEGNVIVGFRNLTGNASVSAYVTTAFGFSGTGTAMTVGKNSSTSRSINAGGTINASGADYAEYEIKNDACGVIQKGQIIGFDADGKITDKFAQSVSFGVKSTNPNLVGGDNWFQEPKPIGPNYTPPDLVKPAYPTQSIKIADSVSAEALAEFDKKTAEYEAAMKEAHDFWKSTTYATYLSALDAHNKMQEIERQKVDRIAYCGKVPVNVTNAKIGDYIVPVEQLGGGIEAVAVADVTFEQYRQSVGQVRRILADGRAEIVVKPI
jgi:hypothetical protein